MESLAELKRKALEEINEDRRDKYERQIKTKVLSLVSEMSQGDEEIAEHEQAIVDIRKRQTEIRKEFAEYEVPEFKEVQL
jgi:plasmid stabilization system protein ParE